MYSFQPLVSTTDHHIGFIVVFCIAILCIAWAIFDYLQNDLSNKNINVALISIFFICFSGYISFTTSCEKTYANEKVVGKFIQYVPQQQTHSCGTKNTQTCYTNKVYVQIEVEGQYILREINPQTPIPPFIQLYKN